MMYLDYLKEREGKDSIYTDAGFIVYKMHNQECHICEIYVEKEKRRTSLATSLADEVTKIAQANGCKILSACVVPSLAGATEAMLAQLSYGFKIHQAHNDAIILLKEI